MFKTKVPDAFSSLITSKFEVDFCFTLTHGMCDGVTYCALFLRLNLPASSPNSTLPLFPALTGCCQPSLGSVFVNIYLLYLAAPGVSCVTWDLVPWPGDWTQGPHLSLSLSPAGASLGSVLASVPVCGRAGLLCCQHQGCCRFPWYFHLESRWAWYRSQIPLSGFSVI